MGTASAAAAAITASVSEVGCHAASVRKEAMTRDEEGAEHDEGNMSERVARLAARGSSHGPRRPRARMLCHS